jgi:hypothetical protein
VKSYFINTSHTASRVAQNVIDELHVYEGHEHRYIQE